MTDIQEQITILVAMQQVEREILQAHGRIVGWEDAAAALDQATAEREVQIEAETDALEGLKKAYREFERQSKVNAAAIDKSDGKLRAVKTNKEYQSILKEIDEMRAKNSDLEDRMIDLLDKIDLQEAAARQKRAQLADFVRSCGEKKRSLADQVRRERESIVGLTERAAQIRSAAAPSVIAVLEEVKKKVRGMAVVPVQRAVCMGCHMNIPAQLFNELLRFDELRFCPHCSRIIYWKEKDEE